MWERVEPLEAVELALVPRLEDTVRAEDDCAADVEPAVRQAFTTPGPALVDVVVNPEEHPRPAMAGGA